MDKLKLHGFNNLTKSLSFNIYDICYTSPQNQQKYIEYIDEVYNAERLTRILTDVAGIIGAHILNIAHQDYEPQGASVTMLISEDPVGQGLCNAQSPGPLPDKSAKRSIWTPEGAAAMDGRRQTVLAHLDKSHITVHTYPESHPHYGISTFRADIDVATCGKISPLKALNYLIHSFDSDIVIMDYRVRGFTRDVSGCKLFIDHDITSIQNFIAADTKARYQMIDVNVYQENIFHTKMMLKDFSLDDYLFAPDDVLLSAGEREEVQGKVRQEMAEIFYGRNYEV